MPLVISVAATSKSIFLGILTRALVGNIREKHMSQVVMKRKQLISNFKTFNFWTHLLIMPDPSIPI